jgi:uncharacterized protein (TIGR02145 family)
VRSSTLWKIDRVDNDFGIENISLTSGGNNTTTGQQVTFTLKHDNTKNGQIAKIILVDPTGEMGEVEVPIKGISCGLGGAEVNKTIGSKLYKTHAYGTGAAQRCWMVQNSTEGASYTLDHYVGDAAKINGKYYTWEQASQANNACPAGWDLPADAEINALIPGVASAGKWWCGSAGTDTGAFAGHTGGGWGDTGNWWGSVNKRAFGSNSASLGGSMFGPYDATSVTVSMSVRCVQRY